MPTSTAPLWNPEQAEEALARFVEMTPGLQADLRLSCGVYLSAAGSYVPFIYKKGAHVNNRGLPDRYVYVIPDGDKFKLQLHDMVIIVGIGIPAKVWPFPVSAEQLSEIVIRVWDNWFSLSPWDDPTSSPA